MPRASTHIFRVWLWPKLYRDIEIDSNKSLYDLAVAIVRAFGFEFDHAFGFFNKLTEYIYDSPVCYELFADLDDDPFADGEHHKAGSVKRTKVSQAFPEVGRKMLFLFDYGANWRFRVEVIGFARRCQGRAIRECLSLWAKAPPQYPDVGEADG